MSDAIASPVEQASLAPTTGPPVSLTTGNWKPVLTLLVLSPAVGELLSGSSPPLQFFNPLFFLLLVGLYGCGALLVRETVARRRLNTVGILLLGAAYGIVEEGLTCKSFFNLHWTDTGFLSVYGRAWGVNWVWAFGLTFYHMMVSITVPIFLTEALFPAHATGPWLRRRGSLVATASLAFVVLLGFLAFDNRQFHLIELRDPLALARQLNTSPDPLARFLSGHLTPKNRALLREAVVSRTDSPDLRHALQEELNRALAREDLYTKERFALVTLPDSLRQQSAKPPRGDKLIEFNRALVELAFPGALAPRQVYPFRPGWAWSLGCIGAIAALVFTALKRTRFREPPKPPRRPWLTGTVFTAAFVVVGFVLPSLVEHGVQIPALADCALWCAIAFFLSRSLKRMDTAPDRPWRRGLWALGVITPWVFFALILGVLVGMIGAKNFYGMPMVSLGFGVAILVAARKWRHRLAPAEISASASDLDSKASPRQSTC